MSTSTTTSTVAGSDKSRGRKALDRNLVAKRKGSLAVFIGAALLLWLGHGAGFNNLLQVNSGWMGFKLIVAVLVTAAIATMLYAGRFILAIVFALVLALYLGLINVDLGLPSWVKLPDLSGTNPITWAVAIAIVLLAWAVVKRVGKS